MKSQNFEFLRRKHPALADLGGFAEVYARTDPGSSLIKLRLFVERVVGLIYAGYGLPRPYSDNLNDLLNETVFRSAVPEVVLNKLHAIRKSGNRAAHREAPSTQVALLNLRDGFDIGQWVHVQLDGGSPGQCPAYREPPPPAQPGAALEKATKEAEAKLAAQEAQLKKVLADLEAERKKREAAEQSFSVTQEQLEQLRAEGQKAANILHFNELATRRRLIDEQLLEAGWDVGKNGKDTEQVRQEVQVFTMPTPSGEGYADYVLYGDDGKPLAVVEAKKTSKDARAGAEQARIYATCLEKETGQRPAAFYTNGSDIYLWDDAQGYTPRKVYGFYSKDSLEYLIHQRKNKMPLAAAAPNLAIAERMYQLEAVKRVSERFDKKFRRALLVQATGTGKTRVAISLCELLMRAGWAKRILFLCDRRELRKQADKVFKEFLPGEPRVVVDSTTSSERDKRIYLATYPAMMKCFESFDVGFFDLVIADESHRSIYKKFRELFLYFDALQVGLTATPVQFIDRDTFKLFGCEDNDPTSNFSFGEAVNSTPSYLVPFRVREFQSKFRKDGFKYSQMSADQRAELEEQEEDASTVEHEADELDKDVFNKPTSRIILRSLMEEGIRDATGSRIGKTIVFARNHLHAVHLAELFDELYPQYGGTFCRVIDNQEARADQLIDDFKNKDSDPVIAISVDMLDTGIDVPEVVNLVFAKPVKSYVKFWQMIGRGTRLCENLFGPGKDKTEFLIFDHGRNFWFFEEKYKEKQPSPQKSLLQKVFEARIAVAEAALEKMNEPVFQATVDLLVQDIRDVIASKSIAVRDRRMELERLSDRETLAQFAAATKADLLSIAAPLMQWRNIRGEEDAYRFDLLVTRLEEAVLKSAPAVADLKAAVEVEVARLMKNQNPVKAKAAAILAVESKEFWTAVTVPKLEDIRGELRGIMKYQAQVTTGRLTPRVFDVSDSDIEGVDHTPKLEGLELIEYRHRVEKVIREHFANDPTLQRIRLGKAVPEEELEALATLVLRVDDKANLKHLVQPELKRSLLDVLRGLVGLDPGAVDEAFTVFVHKHPHLSAQQLRFMQLLKNHIAQNGGIELERLYEPPFTTIHAEGIDGVFTEAGQVDEILAILETFQPRKASPSSRPPPAKQAS
ncbi:DEAD/DEAH box helicase family protein [Polyangium sp. 15x6]|uniref:DEAD/DEAH box helicase family protein n=1 Tax=Polyangium sp. 15x6 TaxID=3042687 RepID=UPI00249C77C6|nr:DEAD/DEAH box helicase family protein [Polyangium sp. 15x6]MDI3289758.1 DEAD/DEAH box helicase family protein [Polyangium sp. 15x6]